MRKPNVKNRTDRSMENIIDMIENNEFHEFMGNYKEFLSDSTQNPYSKRRTIRDRRRRVMKRNT